jgi:hypothetical protein
MAREKLTQKGSKSGLLSAPARTS